MTMALETNLTSNHVCIFVSSCCCGFLCFVFFSGLCFCIRDGSIRAKAGEIWAFWCTESKEEGEEREEDGEVMESRGEICWWKGARWKGQDGEEK